MINSGNMCLMFERVQEGLQLPVEVVVVASRVVLSVLVLVVTGFATLSAMAETLPEDSAQIMYHSYDGGGVTVDGPALLVRKEFLDQFSVSAGYYQDTISGASPDVLASASKYVDSRDEVDLGLTALLGNSLFAFGYTKSTENDYDANSYGFDMSQTFFGGMSTLSLGFIVGQDTVMRSDNNFSADRDRYNFSIGLAQILSPSILMSVSIEGITEEGYLSNPYRSKRVFGSFAGSEIYPRTRSSTAYALRLKKRLSAGDVVSVGYRFFDDSWAIQAHTLELGYTRQLSEKLVLDINYRFYDQSKASFFSSDFDGLYNYMASDKELSTYSAHTIGMVLSRQLFDEKKIWFDSGEVSLSYDFMRNEYADYFAPDQNSATPYSFDVNIFNINFSVWY